MAQGGTAQKDVPRAGDGLIGVACHGNLRVAMVHRHLLTAANQAVEENGATPTTGNVGPIEVRALDRETATVAVTDLITAMGRERVTMARANMFRATAVARTPLALGEIIAATARRAVARVRGRRGMDAAA